MVAWIDCVSLYCPESVGLAWQSEATVFLTVFVVGNCVGVQHFEDCVLLCTLCGYVIDMDTF